MVLAVLLLCCFGGVIYLCKAEHLTHDLNYKWSNRELHSPLAKEIAAHQSKCTTHTLHNKRRIEGMGSEFHVYSQALCIAMEAGRTLVQESEHWQWNDPTLCAGDRHNQPFNCYFNLHTDCPQTGNYQKAQIDNGFDKCPKYIHDLKTRSAFRAAAMEYLFSNLNPALVDEARKAIVDVFGQEGIPEDMITVHIRWGDKSIEMKLVTEVEYFQAIDAVVANHTIAHPHIFVSTEDAPALEKLQEQLTKHGKTWKLHHFAPLVATHTPVHANRGLSGKNTLIALLLAMEAKYYVLTTGSNWSRLMNELRTNVIDVACGNCTHMVDLRQAHTKYQDWRV